MKHRIPWLFVLCMSLLLSSCAVRTASQELEQPLPNAGGSESVAETLLPQMRVITHAVYAQEREQAGVETVSVTADDPLKDELLRDIRTAFTMYEGQNVVYRVSAYAGDIRWNYLSEVVYPDGNFMHTCDWVTIPDEEREARFQAAAESGMQLLQAPDTNHGEHLCVYGELTERQIRQLVGEGGICVSLVDEYPEFVMPYGSTGQVIYQNRVLSDLGLTPNKTGAGELLERALERYTDPSTVFSVEIGCWPYAHTRDEGNVFDHDYGAISYADYRLRMETVTQALEQMNAPHWLYANNCVAYLSAEQVREAMTWEGVYLRMVNYAPKPQENKAVLLTKEDLYPDGVPSSLPEPPAEYAETVSGELLALNTRLTGAESLLVRLDYGQLGVLDGTAYDTVLILLQKLFSQRIIPWRSPSDPHALYVSITYYELLAISEAHATFATLASEIPADALSFRPSMKTLLNDPEAAEALLK